MRAPRRGLPRRPDPEPLEANNVRVVAVGVALWTVALVLTLVFHNRLSDKGNGDWVWIALAGFFLGLLAMPMVNRRRTTVARDRAAAKARRAAAKSADLPR